MNIDKETSTVKMLPWKPLKITEIFFFTLLRVKFGTYLTFYNLSLLTSNAYAINIALGP